MDKKAPPIEAQGYHKLNPSNCQTVFEYEVLRCYLRRRTRLFAVRQRSLGQLRAFLSSRGDSDVLHPDTYPDAYFLSVDRQSIIYKLRIMINRGVRHPPFIS